MKKKENYAINFHGGTDKNTLISIPDKSELPTLPSIHMMEN
jgi:hypothetical protein